MKFFDIVTPRRLGMALFVVPAVLATVYYSFVAVDRYASHSVLSIRDTSSGGSSGGGLSAASLLLGGGGAPVSLSDAYMLESYMHSMAMLLKMDKKFNLRAHYSQPKLDVFYRISADAERERFLDYFNSRVSIAHDEISGLLTVEVQAFDREFAQKLAQAMIDEGESYINENAHRVARDRMAFYEGEEASSLKRVRSAKGDVLAFQTKYKLLDPLSQAVAANTLTASLQATQAKQEADLKAAEAFMSPDSLQVRSLRSQLGATQAQLEVERLRATAAVNGSQLPALAIEYQGLLLQAGYAEDAYKSALLSVEQARLEASRKLKTVLVLESPTLPDLALYPRRIMDWLTVLAVCTMLFAIVRLIYATVREHQD
ncbi:capsular biosynthesis protein [Ideonella azotifigens]|uniref:Capsule polysaccharide export inner-membrane protein KpsE n=1 Tax=Ideonella azotifigens TaxID=513160 RepID=A0ABP3VI96_9BURK|nr:capsular biosynthesis protein [Ideonella azotifigens]MCD2338850.1 capsular biosynthesis protein [Ideonella azotifigens]